MWSLLHINCSIFTSISFSLSPLFCRKVMSAPNLLRVGTAENIFVECQDCTGENILVDINVMNHPTKSTTLASTSVTLTSERNFQELGQITIPADSFSKDPTMKQYVYLQARFPDHLLEKVVLVSFQSGYIFIQTDKTLYTPNSRVHFRMFAVTPRMEPIERQTEASIDIEIVVLYFIFDKHRFPGLWKVVAKFQSNPQQSYSAEFEVKEYVLPSFEVKLMPLSSFFYVDSQDFTVNIKATYLFGQEVAGTAYVVFGVMQDGHKKSFPASLQRVQIENGVGEVTLKTEHITQTYPDITKLVGSSMYVAVSVLTESGGEMVEAELRNIQIVTSPYTITFKKTPTFFKPGMSFDVTVEVVNPDGTPAKGVTVVIEPGRVDGITAANGMAKLSVNTVAMEQRLTITAKTLDNRISNERQASATMVALPYTTPSNKYIHIGVDTPELKLGDNLKFNLILSRQEQQNNNITYLILSRGQLVKNGRYRSAGQVLISLNVPITQNMLPSFRIVAYYHTNDNEVVSDSIWVDVKDSCMGSLLFKFFGEVLDLHNPTYSTFNKYKTVTGDPGAVVGLVAVDKGVYVLNNKHRLTQKKVWDTVEKYDTGCTPGGGKDGMGVFYDAGLLFESNMASGTPYRQELKCPAPSRKKRAATIMDVTTSLGKNHNQLQRDCCLDGMRNTPLSYTCEMRAEYISDGELCAAAFLHCCKEMETQRAERKEDSLILARSEEDDSYLDSNEISSRTEFPESWLWSDVTLDTTSLTRNVPLKDSITTWQFTGISLSRTHGICVGEPLEVIVRKAFFIDLRLPYSAVRGEQLEIKAILHNYSPDPATVRVDLSEEEHVCSSASKRRRYRQEVNMGAKTTRAVPFIIIPMKEGTFNIEIKAAVKDSSLSDGIKKKLLVVVSRIEYRLGFFRIPVQIPMKDLVRNTPTSTQISVTGQILFSALVENAISGNSMGTLIVQPSGCGEQNIARMTLPVIAATYLDKTNQWETVGFQKRNEALQHIKTGYKNELVYRKKDGSFAVWANRESSTWLTAYVAKVFAMANNLVAVKEEHICEAIKFLILNVQQPDGSFIEVGTVIHGEMIGDVRGADSDVSMTAFCLIAMQESRTQCNATVSSLPGSIDKAVNYLERRLPSLTNPYAVAMTSYALASENKLNKEILYKFASTGLSHWPTPKGHIYTLEATAYALLALVKAKATIMVYQAIAEYWTSAKEPEYDLNVDIVLPGRSKPDKFNFNRDNHYTDVYEFITCKDALVSVCQMVSLYYALPKEKESDCQKFNLSVQLLPGNLVFLYKDEERDASMSILDIGLPTGFTVNTADLDLLSKGRARIFPKYEMNTVLSERGSLIIYLDKVKEITFKIHQKLKVGFTQPAAVSIYEYYNQIHCVKFYHPERKDGELMRLCTSDVCRCAEEDCSMQNKEKITNDQRTAKICESTQNSIIDFGTLDVDPQDKQRTFLRYPHCRKSLDLETGKTYLIMGTSKDIDKDDHRSYQYVLGERTWIEYWPTEAECQTQEHRITCLGMEEMVQQYQFFGCQQ
uniref:Complement C3-like n=1 Tax=Sander lucioperca TaxID=283035 RepID=A0A8D0A9C0_SANLU